MARQTPISVKIHKDAFEIPLMAQKIAESQKFDGVVVLGCVIRGDTPHFDYVCKAVTDGCLDVTLGKSFPLAFGVITVNTEEQAIERSSQNLYNKGSEATLALAQSLESISAL